MTVRTTPLGRLLYASTFLISTCGLIYELVAGALASYLLGDSVTQFSLVIGAYLSAMGVGSWLSRHIEGNLVARFVEIEIAVALLGGFEAPLLFAGFTWTPAFRGVLYILVALVGVGVGLELPLLIRILETRTTLKELVARVLFLDYIGALAASLLFPLFLLPYLGLLRTSLALGIVNAAVALWTTFLFDAPPPVRARLRFLTVGALAALSMGLYGAGAFERRMEQDMYADPVVLSEQTPYQRLVVTHDQYDTRLYLDGALQFSSVDEYRYHEALVHPVLARVVNPRRVLVLGGGDGLAVHQVLRYPSVESVTLVDLDPSMTRLFSIRPELAALNSHALNDPRVHIVNDDAFQWLRTTTEASFDAAIVDFPDPNHYALGKLYTDQLYRMLARRMGPGAVISVQATSPLFSRGAFSCIVATMSWSGWTIAPYHAYVPSFGEWGFVLASLGPIPPLGVLPDGLRFLDAATEPLLYVFPRDLAPTAGTINRLDNQALVRLYEDDWNDMGMTR